MERIILKILNMSITAGCLTLVIAALRLFLRRMPRRLFLALWGLVALRLICPFSVQAPFSLAPDAGKILGMAEIFQSDAAPILPAAENEAGIESERKGDPSKSEMPQTGNQNLQAENGQGTAGTHAGSTGIPGSGTQNGTEQNSKQPENVAVSGADTQQGQLQSGNGPVRYSLNETALTETAKSREVSGWPRIAVCVWLAGMACMLIYAVINDLRIRRLLREAVICEGGIRRCDRIGTPFIHGIIRPRICLPVSLEEPELRYVLAHEQTHLRRRDHIRKAFGFALLAVYWFNPLIWVAFILFCRDIEFACDEAVLQTLGSEAKKPYADALINCSVQPRTLAAAPLAFAEANVKRRVQNVLKYKKASFWMAVTAVLLCLVLAGCFMTDPQDGESTASAVTETQEKDPDAEKQTEQTTKPEQTTEPAQTTEPEQTTFEQPAAADAPMIYTGDWYTLFWKRGTEEEQAFAMDPQGNLIQDLAIPEKLTDAVTGELRYYTLRQYETNEDGLLLFKRSWLYDAAGVPIEGSNDCAYGSCIGERVQKYLYAAFPGSENEGHEEWPGYPGGVVPDFKKSTWLYDPRTGTDLLEGVKEIRKLTDDSVVLLDPEGNLIGTADSAGNVTALYEGELPIGSILDRGGFISGITDNGSGLEHYVILNSSLEIVAEADEPTELELFRGLQGAVCVKRTQDKTEVYAAEGWQLLGEFSGNLQLTDGVCAILGTQENRDLFLHILGTGEEWGPYDDIVLLKDENNELTGEYLARKEETLTILNENGVVVPETGIEGLINASTAKYGRILCTYEWKDSDGSTKESRVIYDRQLNRLTARHFEHVTPVTEGIWLGVNLNTHIPYRILLNEKEEELVYDLDDVFGGDAQTIAVRRGYYVGLMDYQGSWITKTELPVEKDLNEKLRLCIEDFCGIMYGSMEAESSVTFGWDDFRTVSGYAVAKSYETMRDAYRVWELGDISEAVIASVQLNAEPVLQGNDYIAEAHISWSYCSGDTRSECGSFYRFTITEENGTFRVADLTDLDNVEFNELMDSLPEWKEACKDAGDKWEFAAVDRIMEQRKTK